MPSSDRQKLSEPIDFDREVAQFERQWLEHALTQLGGVKAQAARLLGVNKDRIEVSLP